MIALPCPRLSALLALLAAVGLVNSCSPYGDLTYYDTAGYETAAVYDDGAGYYHDSYAPVVTSTLFVSSGYSHCSSCRSSPCRCHGHGDRPRPTPYHRAAHRPAYRGADSHHPPSYGSRPGSAPRHHANQPRGQSPRMEGNHRQSAPSLHRNTSPSGQRSRPTTDKRFTLANRSQRPASASSTGRTRNGASRDGASPAATRPVSTGASSANRSRSRSSANPPSARPAATAPKADRSPSPSRSPRATSGDNRRSSRMRG